MVFLLLLLVAAGAALSVAGLVLLQKALPEDYLTTSVEALANYVIVVVALYGVFIAFVIIGLWEDQRNTEANAAREANEVLDIFRIARNLSEPGGPAVMVSLRSYAQSVIEDEWPRMESGDVRQLWIRLPELDAAWDGLMSAGTGTDRDAVLLAEAVSRYEELLDLRRERLMASGEGLPLHMWAIAGVGGLFCLLMLYCVRLENRRAQVVLTGLTGSIILLLFFAIHDLDQPFRGRSRVTPEAFERALDRMGSITEEGARDEGR